MSWEKLERVTVTIPEQLQKLFDVSPEAREKFEATEQWANTKYHVGLTRMGPDDAGGESIHLSIKRHDRKPMPNWRDFQMIKNQLCGFEAEAVELFPAESRVVDMANQYHLWAFTKQRIKIGWPTGSTMTPEQAAIVGATQEPFDDDKRAG